jgi:divalent metal cation (Fe/Co/Zn/Cd) transporter
VIASLIAVEFGLTWVDSAAALVVVVLIGIVAWRIVSNAAAILVDRAALDAGAVSQVVQRVAGVQGVARVRSRGPSDEVHLDLDLQVAGPTTAEHTDAIAGEVRKQLRERFTGLDDIQVNFVPRRDTPPDITLTARAQADALGLGVHEVISIPTSAGDMLALEMHVEVEPDQSVGEAHALVTEFERRLKGVIPNLERIVTHIEPAEKITDVPTHDGIATILERKALNIAEALYPKYEWHELEVRPEPDGGYALSMHCHVSASMPLEQAHHIAEEVETRVRAALPELHRVTIHTEPPDEDL